MIKICSTALVLLFLCACGGGKQTPKNVGGTVTLPQSELTDTLPVKVTTSDIPANIVVMTTAEADKKADQAMNKVIQALKGVGAYHLRQPVGDAVRDQGGPLNMRAQTKKISYVTGLAGTGVFSDDDIFVRAEIVSLDFMAHQADSVLEGRLVDVDFPEGNKKLKVGDHPAVVNAKECFSYSCVIGLKVLGMLEDGTYAREIAYITGTVIIPNDFKMRVRTR
jgi:hypothetical protein